MFNDMNIPLDKSLRAMMQTIYGWMSAALAVTAAVSYYISSTPSAIQFVFNTPWLFLVLFLVQIGLVITLSAAISKITSLTSSSNLSFDMRIKYTPDGEFIINS